MGCCLSTTTKSKSHKTNPDSLKSNPNVRAPPPPPPPPPPAFEEETVKEVLSETPIPKPPTPKPTYTFNHHHHQASNHLHPVAEQPKIQPTATIKPNNSYNNHHHQGSSHLHPVADEEQRIQPTAAMKPNNSYRNHLLLQQQQQASGHLNPVAEQPKIQPTAAIKPPDEIVSEVSSLSELYSYSESLSTVTDKRDDIDGEVTQRVHRSPIKRIQPRRRAPDAGRVRSPARRSEPSPARTQVSLGRNTTTARRNVGPPNAIRRDPGEGSGRRSRSPATRGEGGARRQARSTGREDRRSRTPAGRREGGGAVEKRDDGGVVVPETAEEVSLDNPNVSLECFIFL